MLKRLLLPVLLIIITFHVSMQETLGQRANNSVSGSVVDAISGNSLPGATIVIVNSNLGTVTDFQGNFKISGIPTSKAILKISFMGYKTAELACDFSKKNTLTLKIKLSEELTNLQSVDIMAEADGQTKAMIRQREATNIKILFRPNR
jgi:iron complex outermembrane recepter protein